MSFELNVGPKFGLSQIQKCPLKHRVYTKHYKDSNLHFGIDMADDVDERKGTPDMVFYLGPNPNSCSQNQKVVAISSCEAEYIAVSTVACQCVWPRRLLADLTKREV